jgi:hypothetical protein
MSWRMDSTAGAAIWDTQPMSADELTLRDEEIRWLIAHERQDWGLINGRLKADKALTAYGTYAGMAAIPPTSSTGFQANVASINGEAALWTTSLFTPWLANSLVSPSLFKVHVSWQTTTSTSPANLTLNPRIGSISSGSSSTGGIALGADAAITLTASITTDWFVDGMITVGSIGAPGTNSKAIADFNVTAKPASAGTGAATINDIFGFTQASFDASIASGFVLGMANTVTTITYAVSQILWLSYF